MAHQNILVLDDDVLFCESLQDLFRKDPVEVSVAHTLAEGRAACRSTFDVILVDHQLPDGFGMDLIAEITPQPEHTAVFLVTGHSSIEIPDLHPVVGVLTKPLDIRMLRANVLRQIETSVLETKASNPSDWIGQSSAFLTVQQDARRAAVRKAPVLITGQTGTGKGRLARYIHDQSPRASGPFVKVNCAALPESLIESELFGVTKGAYTGAFESRPGAFERAHGGTLFLDEVAELPLHQQTKLLSVLDDFMVRRLGGVEERAVDVRLIAATNLNLDAAVTEGRFRADLFYRLNVFWLKMPALRVRQDDFERLAHHFLRRHADCVAPTLAEGELERLTAHDWPGNVREFENCIQRACAYQSGPTFTPSAMLMGSTYRPPAEERPSSIAGLTSPGSAGASLAEVERRHIISTLTQSGDCRAEAARRLGISVATLRRKLKTYGIDSIPSTS